MRQSFASPNRARIPQAKIDAFLDALGSTSNVAYSAQKAKLNASSVYRLRRSDPKFAARWMEALSAGYELLEFALLHRLRTGETRKPAKSEQGTRVYDTGTAMRLLLAHKDSVAQQRGLHPQRDDDTIRREIEIMLDALKAKEKARKQQERRTGAKAGRGADAGKTANGMADPGA